MSDAEAVRNLLADRLRGLVETEGVETHLLSDNLDVLFLASSREYGMELFRTLTTGPLIVVPRSNEEDSLDWPQTAGQD